MKNVLVKFAQTVLTLTFILACLAISTNDSFAQRTAFYKKANTSKFAKFQQKAQDSKTVNFRAPRGTGKYTVYKTANGGKIVATTKKGVVQALHFVKNGRYKTLRLATTTTASRAATCKICHPTSNGTIECFEIPCDWIVIETLKAAPTHHIK